MNEEEWEKTASRHMKAAMAKRGLDIPKLTELFLAKGYLVTRDSIRGKVDRGKYSFIFYLQFMHVIGADTMEMVSPNNFEEIDIHLR